MTTSTLNLKAESGNGKLYDTGDDKICVLQLKGSWQEMGQQYGALALKDGKVLNVNAGQSIRYPVESKGRFVPVDVNKWLDEHAIKTPGVQGIDDTGSGRLDCCGPHGDSHRGRAGHYGSISTRTLNWTTPSQRRFGCRCLFPLQSPGEEPQGHLGGHVVPVCHGDSESVRGRLREIHAGRALQVSDALMMKDGKISRNTNKQSKEHQRKRQPPQLPWTT